ncbi:MAG: class I SAM-dependent RNA methyltransferase [Dictyoglomi bacterium]|nr:class I SAM-dependent RNA methyltransferase [Dictyoglomota bacterium]
MKMAEVEKIVYGGYGLIRDPEEGVVLIDDDVLPGDKITYEIVQRKKGTNFGVVLEINEPSPMRKTPDCPVFPQCGGCRFRSVSYEDELSIKEHMIEDMLSRSGLGGVPVEDIRPTVPVRYRNRITWHFYRGKLGFWSRGKRTLVPTLDCILGPKSFSEILAEVEQFPQTTRAVVMRQHGGKVLMIIVMYEPESFVIKKLPPRGKWAGLVTMINKNNREILHGKIWNSWGHSRLTETVDGLQITIPPRAFFQVNNEGLSHIINILKTHLEPSEKIVDLYAGVGALLLPLAQYHGFRIGVEANRESARAMKINGKNNKIPITVYPNKAEEVADDVLPGTETLVLDPPRSGISEEIIEKIIDYKPRQIAYISCHPPAMFRDITLLSEYYEIETIIPIDMFPRTWHIEMLTILRLRRG